MAEREWFKDATAAAMRGSSRQLTFWTQREAKICLHEYVEWLRRMGITGWTAIFAMGSQSVRFKSGGSLWFDSHRHAPRPGAAEWFRGGE